MGKAIRFQLLWKERPGSSVHSVHKNFLISSPEISGSSVSSGSPGRTLGTRNFYRRNRAVPVLVRMLGFDKNGSHHYESQLQPISAGTAGIRFLGRDTVFCQSAVHLNKTTKCRCHSGFGPPFADLDPPTKH